MTTTMPDGTTRGAGNDVRASDALVLFGATGDLSHKKIFPALCAMARRGALTVPVIGVASSGWKLDRLRERVRDSVARAPGGVDDEPALDRQTALLGYVDGDYADPATFSALRRALGDAERPAHYLAIPPARELLLLDTQPDEEEPYERLLGDAMAGEGALFPREDAVEAAWAVVDPVLTSLRQPDPYRPGSWGPARADQLIAANRRRRNPEATGAERSG